MKHIVMLLFVALLAGCSDETKDAPDEPGTGVPPPIVTDETGAIQGIVFDMAVFPVVGATVTDMQTGKTAVTNENGGFALSELLPGTHFLTVDALGYGAVQANADVVANQVTEIIKIQLTSAPSELPLVEHLPFNGYLACSASSPAIRAPLCNYVQTYGEQDLGEQAFQRIETKGYPDYVLGEMAWEGTQTLGDGLYFMMWDGTGFSPIETEGSSPLTIRADRDVLQNGTGTWKEGESPMLEPGEEFAWGWYPGGSDLTKPPVCPADLGISGVKCWGAGVSVDQTFEIYTSIFYRVTPPEDYSFYYQGQFQG